MCMTFSSWSKTLIYLLKQIIHDYWNYIRLRQSWKSTRNLMQAGAKKHDITGIHHWKKHQVTLGGGFRAFWRDVIGYRRQGSWWLPPFNWWHWKLWGVTWTASNLRLWRGYNYWDSRWIWRSWLERTHVPNNIALLLLLWLLLDIWTSRNDRDIQGWYERSSAAEVWLQTSERRTHMPGRQCLGPSID